MPKRAVPTCGKCSQPHWAFQPCVAAAKPAGVVVHRRREGYIDRADRMLGDTQRMGETTFARKRDPGERHGAMRPAA